LVIASLRTNLYGFVSLLYALLKIKNIEVYSNTRYLRLIILACCTLPKRLNKVSEKFSSED